MYEKEISLADSPIEVRHARSLCTSSFQGELDGGDSLFSLNLTVPHSLQGLSSVLIPTSGQEPSRGFGHKDPDCATRGTNENQRSGWSCVATGQRSGLTGSDDPRDPVLGYETGLVRPLAVQGPERVDDQGDDDPTDRERDGRKGEQDASESQRRDLPGCHDAKRSAKNPHHHHLEAEALCRLTSPI
jgi:hypothetical protein